jgi:uncharacterized protein (TIGR02147 family)
VIKQAANSPHLSPAMPSICDFLDYREYLKCIYEWRKQSSSGFSYSLWADELGFKSRSFIRLIVTGKRAMTSNTVLQFLRSLKLKQTEADYFELLVKFNQSIDHHARKHYEKQILKFRSTRLSRSGMHSDVLDHYRFLSSYLGPRIQVLLSLDDIEKTSQHFASLLGTKVQAVEEILETLERIGMAEKVPTERSFEWKSTTGTFEVRDHLGDVALQSFHRKSLEEAIMAMDTDTSLRKYQSIIVPLSSDEFSEVNQQLYSDLMAVLEKYKSDEGSGRRLYQINLNLIPTTTIISDTGTSPRRVSEEVRDPFVERSV